MQVRGCHARPVEPRGHGRRTIGITVGARVRLARVAAATGPGVPLSRAQIEDRLLGWGEEVASNAVEVQIHNLRRKVGPTTCIRPCAAWATSCPRAGRRHAARSSGNSSGNCCSAAWPWRCSLSLAAGILVARSGARPARLPAPTCRLRMLIEHDFGHSRIPVTGRPRHASGRDGVERLGHAAPTASSQPRSTCWPRPRPRASPQAAADPAGGCGRARGCSRCAGATASCRSGIQPTCVRWRARPQLEILGPALAAMRRACSVFLIISWPLRGAITPALRVLREELARPRSAPIRSRPSTLADAPAELQAHSGDAEPVARAASAQLHDVSALRGRCRARAAHAAHRGAVASRQRVARRRRGRPGRGRGPVETGHRPRAASGSAVARPGPSRVGRARQPARRSIWWAWRATAWWTMRSRRRRKTWSWRSTRTGRPGSPATLMRCACCSTTCSAMP